MKLRVIENKKPELKISKMKCDVLIHEELKKYPLIRDCMNTFRNLVVLGKMGAGKTSFILSLLKNSAKKGGFKKCFHKIYLWMPTSSRSSLNPNIFECLPDEQVFDTLDYDNLSQVYEEIKANKAEGNDFKCLLIFDDVQTQLKSNMAIINLLNQMIIQERHLGICMWFLLQNYFSIHLKVRELIDNILFFKLDKVQQEKIFKEVAELPKDIFYELSDYIFDEPHNFCFINKRIKSIYKNWDELQLIEDDEDENNKV